MKTAFKVGDTVHLKSSPSCSMTVARVPGPAHPDLLKPAQVECVWLDKNHQAHFSRFPLAMVAKSSERLPIGFKTNNRQ
ncbi:hypothetical protein [Pontibacter kalidii]|uniref:hypothetical protein n=1 Tax=Pontibacter kalidii TaxID=2592049 RepID=UPI0022552925|nr:hypothetical protein [Pontibacter kalidii]